MTNHPPVRPAWTCAGCGEPWPCRTRREQLTASYARAWVSLDLYLAACLVDACHDLPDERAGVLWGRFIGWIRRGRQ